MRRFSSSYRGGGPEGTLFFFNKLVPEGGGPATGPEGTSPPPLRTSSSTLSLTHRGLEKGLADLKTAELAITKAIQEYKEPSYYSGSFRELAYGVFQAEGCVSA